MAKRRASNNRTLTCSSEEQEYFARALDRLEGPADVAEVTDAVFHQEWLEAVPFLPKGFVDLVVMDPPYNLRKVYDGRVFEARHASEYASWFERVIESVMPLLAETASVYVCSDWRTSVTVFPVLELHFTVRNRITWEREKGRGSKRNWKNTTEDIWFCTVGSKYHFDAESVKLKRAVLAPYRNKSGEPKDWKQEPEGRFRLTHPSNIWTDITIPFWSMSENTDHPAQKSEKLISKLVLASSRPGDFVLDPFLGSGTTAVVAKKLGRRFAGFEISRRYCLLALKRLHLADHDASIQGYREGVFWERNTKGK